MSAHRDDGPFAERLARRIKSCGTSLCVGIDPPLDPPVAFKAMYAREGSAAYLDAFARVLIDAAAGVASAVKLQSAYFEAHGAPGFEALADVAAYARSQNLLVILDAKRGDISSTMRAYGVMAFDIMQADALTVAPYMGLDVVEPLLPWLRHDRGVYVVWVSSNPGGALIQEQRLEGARSFETGSTTAEVWLQEMWRYFGDQDVRSAFGLVLGATKFDHIMKGMSVEGRQALKDACLLMPGVGAQGGAISEALSAYSRSSAPILVPQSRSLIMAGTNAQSIDEFRRACEATVRQAARETRLADAL